MTDTRQLTEDIAVCAFVPPHKLAELAPKFRTILNARPDAEEPGQPSSAEIEAEARRLGLEYVHIPVVPGQFTDEQVAGFASAVSAKEGPVLAFCRSGKRAATLWALSEKGKRSTQDIISAAAAAGYDLAEIRPQLEKGAPAA